MSQSKDPVKLFWWRYKFKGSSLGDDCIWRFKGTEEDFEALMNYFGREKFTVVEKKRIKGNA